MHCVWCSLIRKECPTSLPDLTVGCLSFWNSIMYNAVHVTVSRSSLFCACTLYFCVVIVYRQYRVSAFSKNHQGGILYRLLTNFFAVESGLSLYSLLFFMHTISHSLYILYMILCIRSHSEFIIRWSSGVCPHSDPGQQDWPPWGSLRGRPHAILQLARTDNRKGQLIVKLNNVVSFSR